MTENWTKRIKAGDASVYVLLYTVKGCMNIWVQNLLTKYDDLANQ